MRPMAPELHEKFRASGRLPSPKGVALAIVRLLRRDEYRTDDLVQLLKSDPAIVGRLLKFANSAAFGATRPIVSIAKAALVLGAFRVRDLVLGFSILHEYRRNGCDEFDYARFWSRSLATAIAAQSLSKHAQIAAEEAFTLGLLCDIGELALASFDCAAWTAARGASGAATPSLEAERASFGTDRRQLGATLMAEWGLPAALADVAYHCEAPDESEFPVGSRFHILTRCLHLACAVGAVCVGADGERSAMLPELYAKAAGLGMPPDELAAMVDDVAARWREWGRTLEIETRELPSFADLLSAVPPAADVATRAALVVAGDAAEAAHLGRLLAVAGFTVRNAASGIDGLMMALRDSPDLVVVDLDSPELDGAAFCRAFRASPLTRDAYLVLLGGQADERRLAEGVDAGADDYLLRPITEQSLRMRLRTAGKIVHLRDEIRRERRGLVRSAHEWAGSQRRLMQVALTDPLTRLPNRRHGSDFLAAEWTFARDHGLPLACLMVDIDHFKAVNDRWGHDAGDAVLAGVARVIGESCRSEDMAFRYGGEEFCVVCTDTGIEAARAIAERIRGGIEIEHFAWGGEEIMVTASVGVAALSATHADVEALVKAADAALYRAKEKGRNRVELAA